MTLPDVPSLIRHVTAGIIKASFQHGAFTPYHVNNGWCYELARDVSNELRKQNVQSEILDSLWLIRRGPMEGRKSGIGRMGAHEFLLVDGRYYDAECPDGVENPYDIPMAIAAVNSMTDGDDIEKFLLDDDAVGVFPAPEPVRYATVETWRQFTECTDENRATATRQFAIALDELSGPVRHTVGPEGNTKLVAALSRVLNSFGIESEVEIGAAPEQFGVDGEHAWLKLPDGTIADLLKSPEKKPHALYGDVLLVDAENTEFFAFTPDQNDATFSNAM